MTSDPNSSSATIPQDALASLAPPDVQKRAARMAQDAFAQVFRLTVNADDAARAEGVAELAGALRNWSAAADGDAARGLRLAMVMAGLDQWGLAYTQAFSLTAIPGLSELLGALRTSLDPKGEAHLQQQFAAINAAEGNVIDFKIDLRRGLHLALWHAMIACETREQADAILTRLGGMLVALVTTMPQLGWRLVADALANVQIACVAEGLAADGIARETTEALFASLGHALPAEVRDRAFAHAGQALVQWQRARRADSGTVH